jgi:hypothetical protein
MNRMKTLGAPALILAALTALTAAAALAKPSVPDIELIVKVQVPDHPVAVGKEGEALVTLTPPSGVHINQYPPMRLTLDPSPPLVFPQSEIKMGLDKMPEDISKNPFEKIEPMVVKFRVSDHAGDASVPVTAKLKYFYCVAKSGYCAPGVKNITFTVPITATP